MSLLGTNITGDSVNPRNGFQKVPLASLQLDSLAPSTQYYLKIISKSATDSLVSNTSFYTDSVEEAYNYCTLLQGDFLDCELNTIQFNQLQFTNPSSNFFKYNRLVPDTGSWTTTLAQGETYTLSITPSCMAGFHNIMAYIDFNHNGIFDEEGFYITAKNTEQYSDINIPIPQGAYTGKTRMRFVTRNAIYKDNIPPCDLPSYLDFTVTIVLPDSCKDFNYTYYQTPPCFNEKNGSLSISPTGGTSPYTIQWNTGNAADTLPVLADLSANATHRATIADAKGCNLRTTMAIVSQNSPVRLDTSLLSQTKLLLKGETASYEVKITDKNTNTQTLYTGINDTLNLHNLPDGIYTVKLSDAHACTYELGEIKLLHTGILRDRAAKEVILYPNPATTYTTVQGLKNFTTKIYGSNGMMIKEIRVQENGLIDLKGLKSGMYLLQILKENELYSQKLLVK